MSHYQKKIMINKIVITKARMLRNKKKTYP